MCRRSLSLAISAYVTIIDPTRMAHFQFNSEKCLATKRSTLLISPNFCDATFDILVPASSFIIHHSAYVYHHQFPNKSTNQQQKTSY